MTKWHQVVAPSLVFLFTVWLLSCDRRAQPIPSNSLGNASAETRASPFGVLMTVPSPSELPKQIAMLKATKVRWVGLDIPLSRIAPKEGVFQWNPNGFESTLKALKEAGIHISLKFLGQADWLSRDPKGPHSDWDATLNLTPPKDKATWQGVVRQVVQRYRDYCDTWQIGNEPDGGGYFRGSADDYMAYLEWTVGAIRSVQPNATIVAADLFLGLRPPPNSYGDVLRKLVRRPDLFDVLSVHYPIGRPQDGAGIDDYFRAMQEAGIKKPIWNTEQFGSFPCEWLAQGQPTHIRTEGATHLSPSKALIHCLALGMEKVFLWEWNYSANGIAARPAAQIEFRTTVEQLEGSKFVRQINTGDPDLTIYQFVTSNREHLLVGWTEVGGKAITMSLKTVQPVTVINHRGEKQEQGLEKGWATITWRSCPQFVRPVPKEIRWQR